MKVSNSKQTNKRKCVFVGTALARLHRHYEIVIVSRNTSNVATKLEISQTKRENNKKQRSRIDFVQ